ncbi:hypothetical protein K458DRAFT_408523 [Lentithecium fluviatile CBS 122367]|uniref:F-box domain-containing protein n=1 Tax=Lentithecium fluviatile CBS 122367 TaxID=1168545 RepID=A0A6G1IKQ2_9PLEO|nr:hypothetical protein K458DRAFT_408523 [Lentithecium fluviatile CBS 122367]
MRQSRLESYLDVPPHATREPPQPDLGLLELPPAVRRRIYKHAGLAGNTIDLNFSNLLIYPYQQYPDSAFAVRSRCAHNVDFPIVQRRDDTAPLGAGEYWEVEEEGDAHQGEAEGLRLEPCDICSDGRGLLFVCKKISEEVVPFVYSNSTFTVRQRAPHGLRRLNLVGKQGLAALSSLTMKLDAGDGQLRVDTEYSEEWPPQPLDLNNSLRVTMKEYEAVIEHLSNQIRPRSLSLHLIFRVSSFDTIHKVLHPLYQLSPLKECGIWTFVGLEIPGWLEPPNPRLRYLKLSQLPLPSSLHSPSTSLRETELVVHKAIHRLISYSPVLGSGFRYLDLPTELRLQILGYTDLVSAKDIQWRPQTSSPPRYPVKELCSCPRNVHPEVLDYSRDCFCLLEPQRTPIVEQIDTREPCGCCTLCRPADASRMCFCSSRGRIFSTTCVCSSPRHALFSVSREVREDAIATYYSRNRFFVTPFRSPRMQSVKSGEANYHWPPRGFERMRSIELSLYLSSLTRNALQHIRWLEWMLPTSKPGYLLPSTPAWFDYLDTLDMMRQSMNITNLTFVLNMAAQGRMTGWFYDVGYETVSPTAWDWYRQIALALQRLGPLRDCFIYLGRNGADSGSNERITREESLERAIMGKHYESRKRGKPEERITAIVRDIWEDPHHYGQPGPVV